MATLVLSTVGTALGGPIGSAIGAMIGQSIDQQLLAPPRRGPRVGDLAVQTSTYGTQVPRLYGTIRVAGSVIWSTDLIENVQTDGAKGQPDVSYNYTVSLAVALSSRPVTAIKRIWADGKVLRGEAGDLKVGGTLRLLTGSEEQDVDPFIASVEGIDSTPAYKGLALAVFEGLELAEYGNRIPSFTFEVEASGGEPTCGEIIGDASGGAVWSDASDLVRGYAAYGRSIREAIQPLVNNFGVELFDDGEVLKSPSWIAPLEVSEVELGNSADGDAVPTIEREQLPARNVPTSVSLSFYDAARDYQTGEARASASDNAGGEARYEFPAVLTADDAKSLAQRMMSGAWGRRDKLMLRLPRRLIDIQPGQRIALPVGPGSWVVEQVTIEAFVIAVDLRSASSALGGLAADPGRIAPNPDVVAGPISLALLDIPVMPGMATSQPTILLGASQAGPGWKARPVDISFGGQSIATTTARSKSILGQTTTVLGVGSAHLIDTVNSVEVTLVDLDQWLRSCDDDALAAGGNLAVIGQEVFQFGDATSLGGGRFALSRLLRGRAGTEVARFGHTVGETFCLLRPGTVQSIALPPWSSGADVIATTAAGNSTIAFQARSLRPLSPVNLRGEFGSNGQLKLGWTRRSRLGLAWLDGGDVPLGEASERYRINIVGTAGSIEFSAATSEFVVDVPSLVAIGLGPATIQVAQLGDFGASTVEQLDIIVA